ncbi:M23 family metallopeptidase [Tumidithrix elongata RA019]|uniref:M23 family metallopeptidase n=1 Tax=Tumidithrix elongata BACA0141 TaxID=2716417 RepID=A0AAW9PPN3_9CYAN|nr:M23 family metallopeptidase [Tumidithrix elongata RA019]
MLRLKLKPLFLIVLSLVAIAIAVVAGVPKAEALQAALSPANPLLGDTVTVWIATKQTTKTPPSVTINQKQYPAFLVAPNRWRAFIPTTPLDRVGDRQVRVVAEGLEQMLTLRLLDRDFPTQSIWLDEKAAALDVSDYEYERVSAFKQLATPQKFWRGAFLRPNDGPVTTGFGVRRYYNGVFANDYYHRGVDYAGDEGSAVIAPAPGQVRLVGTVAQGFQLHGNTIGVDHGQGVASIFIHLSRINVREGDFVQAGQVIGAVGSTGAATGPHLHWGLYVNGESIDPVPWREQGLQ